MILFTESLQLKGKLLGGELATHLTDSYYKYITSLIYNKTIFCTAAIVSPKHILTAGHCISDLIFHNNVEKLKNSYALIATDKMGVREPYFFQQVEVHPDCDLETYSPAYDIAVVTVNHEYILDLFKLFLAEMLIVSDASMLIE